MKHTDNVKFKNQTGMLTELAKENVFPASIFNNREVSEAEIVFQYNLQFLANTYQHHNESRLLAQNNTRTKTGKFK